MALINCSECKKEISDKAVSCPHCGFPISELKTSIKIDPSLNNFLNKEIKLNIPKSFKNFLFPYVFF